MTLKIELVQGFTNLAIGDAQLLRIKNVAVDEKFKKVKLTFEDEKGRTLVEQYMLSPSKEGKSVGLMILSTIAKCATDNFADRPFDPEDLKGLYIVADVYEQVSTAEDGKVSRYVHLRNYNVASGTFDDDADVGSEDDEDDDDIWG